jgi:hypothetical protein
MSMLEKLRLALSSADAIWQQRKRKINTTCIFNDLTQAVINKRGLRHVLHKSESEYTPEALGQARRKLPDNLFADINRSLQDKEYRRDDNAPRIFAIDGSKVHVHPCYMKQGYTTRTNNQPVTRPAIRPLAMLSSMLDVNTRACYDSQITSHFNERASALQHMQVAKPGDTLLFDRGYYSQQLVQAASEMQLKVLFRLKRTAFKGANTFWNSNKASVRTRVYHPDGSYTPVLLVKYFIDGKKYMNLVNFEANTNEIRHMYSLRWRVETSFKRLKSYLHLEDSHSMTAELFIQEVQARILLDTVTQHNTTTATATAEKQSYLKVLDEVADFIFMIKIATCYGLTRAQYGRLLRQFHPARVKQ